MTAQLEEDLNKARAFHGHLCSGIVLGVRLSRAGLHYLGIDDPSENRDFMVYCEIDRCLTDAIQSVTGISAGKRRLKIREYGKMAASFVDMNTNKGVRIVVSGRQSMPDDADPVTFWDQYPDDEIFTFQPVTVEVPLGDMPGRPIRSVFCEKCGEKIMDAKDVSVNDQTLCRTCADGTSYYRRI
jgi:formylmethanofuran dehydrogenase subunit E